MKVLIIEDETPAAEKLERFLNRLDEPIEILSILKSVSESVEWFQNHDTSPDLIFMDIQLQDGQSFEIFDKVEIKSPIIFISAYDEFALEAFKVNGVAYLMKPLFMDDLRAALDKIKSLKKSFNSPDNVKNLAKNILGGEKHFKRRFMVRVGDHIKSIPTNDIQLVFAEGRTAYIVLEEARKFIIDYKLEELEDLLDTEVFMRVNRSFILNIGAIKDVIVYSNSRLKVLTNGNLTDKEIIVSRDKVGVFKNWINDEVS